MSDLPPFDAQGVPRRASLAGDLRQRAEGFRRRRIARLPDALGAGRAAAQDHDAARSSRQESAVSGFVFKVQANMDPNHRDRIAFVRLCSGKFKRGMRLFNVREKKSMNVAAPIFFFAQQRETIDEAFRATSSASRTTARCTSATVSPKARRCSSPASRTSRRKSCAASCWRTRCSAKQLNKALNDLAEEGVIQIFRPVDGSWPILGAVGALQLDVLTSRLKQEYGVSVRLETAPYETARWIVSEMPEMLERFRDANRSSIAEDRQGSPVFLARNVWALNREVQDWPDVRFVNVRERN